MILKRRKGDFLFNTIIYSMLILILLIELYPLIFIVSASFSDPDFVNAGKVYLFPRGFTLDGYIRVFKDAEIWNGYKNTMIYTGVGTALSVFTTIPAAYALSRKDFIGRNIFTAIFAFTMFFSGGLIPTYIVVKNLKMVNTMFPVILLGTCTMWNMVIARTFFQSSIPEEIIEAGYIDGCSDIRIFIKIVLPLSSAIIAVISLFYGVTRWNGYFNALIYLSDRKLYPLQLILREILIQQQSLAELMVADDDPEYISKQVKLVELIKYCVIFVATLPVLIAYPFVQKYFVKGVVIGAIKG